MFRSVRLDDSWDMPRDSPTAATTTSACFAGKEAAQKIVQQLGVNRMLEKFSQEAIEQLVTKAVQKVGYGAIDKGVEMTAKEVTKAVTKEINREVLQVALKASTYTAVNVTRSAVAGASQITSG